MEVEYHFLGNAAVAEGRDRTAFAPFKDEPQKFDMGKLALNILGGLTVAGMVFSDIKNGEVSDFMVKQRLQLGRGLLVLLLHYHRSFMKPHQSTYRRRKIDYVS